MEVCLAKNGRASVRMGVLKQEAEDLNFKRNVEMETGRIHGLVFHILDFYERQYLPLIDGVKKVESLPALLHCHSNFQSACSKVADKQGSLVGMWDAL